MSNYRNVSLGAEGDGETRSAKHEALSIIFERLPCMQELNGSLEGRNQSFTHAAVSASYVFTQCLLPAVRI